jgi:phytol kinase
MGEAFRHFARFIPSLSVVAIVAPLALLYSLAMGALAAHLRLRRGVRAPYTRKVFHFGIFTMAAVSHWIWDAPGVVVFGSVVALVVLFAVYRGDGFPLYEALARPTDAPHRSLFIIVPLVTTAVGGVISNLLFLRFAFVGYLVCGWGDAVGEPVGARWGKRRYRVPSLAGLRATRSLEGSAAVLLVGSLAAFAGLLTDGFQPSTALGIALAAGAVGAFVEAFSSHGLDNLTVQIAASGVAYLIAM